MPTKLLVVTTVETTLSAFLLPFADHFRARGWVVDGMAAGITTNPECAAHFDEIWEMKWTRNPRSRANIDAIARVRQIAVEREYDLVHIHTPIAGFVTRLALRELRRTSQLKVIYTAHGFHCHPEGSLGSNTAFCGLERLAGSWTDALVVINHEDERLARRIGLAGRGRIYYMPGIGINLEDYSRARISPEAVASLRCELGLDSRAALFLMAARFDPGKRHADAVRAFRLMWEPGVHLAFAGVGPEMERIRALVEELGLSESVHFLDSRNDVPTLLAASVALLLPSSREGLSRSILESMAIRTPVIGTRVRGINELLGGGAGLLAGLGDVQSLSEAMRRVLREPEEAQTMADRAYKRVRRYALPRVLTLHDEMYEDLLSSASRVPTPL